MRRSFVRQINLDKPFLDHFRDEHDILMRQCGIGAAGDEDRGFSTGAVLAGIVGGAAVGAIGMHLFMMPPKKEPLTWREEFDK
jgi:hypothetical protein